MIPVPFGSLGKVDVLESGRSLLDSFHEVDEHIRIGGGQLTKVGALGVGKIEHVADIGERPKLALAVSRIEKVHRHVPVVASDLRSAAR